MEQTECSETLAYKIQTPGNYPEESTQQGIGKFVPEHNFTPHLEDTHQHTSRCFIRGATDK